ncbi:MAG TPA: 2'-5' RNA ligase family protein [Solirubrobacteraceae bacterium]|nr:2'-5' RNA ligase family protein [Solirubrobacteraceae bacterium]
MSVGAAARRLARGLGLHGPTALVIPVPVADRLVRRDARARGLGAHITVLHPFIDARKLADATDVALAECFAAAEPFDFVLQDVERFPSVVYLAPDPADPFVALTHAVVERWPERLPYEGRFDSVVPHLTVAYGSAVPAGLSAALPLQAEAREVWLMRKALRRWWRMRVYPLGHGTASAAAPR